MTTSSSPDVRALEATARGVRRTVLEMCAQAGGHLASSLSCVDILVALYCGGPLRPMAGGHDRIDRDRFILSKGHGEAGLYAILGDQGYFPTQWLWQSYRRGACLLGGHPDHHIPGIEISSGSLGHGLGIAAGMALAAQIDGRARSGGASLESGAERAGHGREPCFFVLLGDAECTEGSVWEAAMFAAHRRLDNLVAIVDRNRIGSLDYTENYTGLEPLGHKWRAFGWELQEVDGHDLSALLRSIEQAREARVGAPQVIVANTTKGKGISFVENDPVWHVRGISPQEVVAARAELAEP